MWLWIFGGLALVIALVLVIFFATRSASPESKPESETETPLNTDTLVFPTRAEVSEDTAEQKTARQSAFATLESEFKSLKEELDKLTAANTLDYSLYIKTTTAMLHTQRKAAFVNTQPPTVLFPVPGKLDVSFATFDALTGTEILLSKYSKPTWSGTADPEIQKKQPVFECLGKMYDSIVADVSTYNEAKEKSQKRQAQLESKLTEIIRVMNLTTTNATPAANTRWIQNPCQSVWPPVSPPDNPSKTTSSDGAEAARESEEAVRIQKEEAERKAASIFAASKVPLIEKTKQCYPELKVEIDAATTPEALTALQKKVSDRETEIKTWCTSTSVQDAVLKYNTFITTVKVPVTDKLSVENERQALITQQTTHRSEWTNRKWPGFECAEVNVAAYLKDDLNVHTITPMGTDPSNWTSLVSTHIAEVAAWLSDNDRVYTKQEAETRALKRTALLDVYNNLTKAWDVAWGAMQDHITRTPAITAFNDTIRVQIANMPIYQIPDQWIENVKGLYMKIQTFLSQSDTTPSLTIKQAREKEKVDLITEIQTLASSWNTATNGPNDKKMVHVDSTYHSTFDDLTRVQAKNVILDISSWKTSFDGLQQRVTTFLALPDEHATQGSVDIDKAEQQKLDQDLESIKSTWDTVTYGAFDEYIKAMGSTYVELFTTRRDAVKNKSFTTKPPASTSNVKSPPQTWIASLTTVEARVNPFLQRPKTNLNAAEASEAKKEQASILADIHALHNDWKDPEYGVLQDFMVKRSHPQLFTQTRVDIEKTVFTEQPKDSTGSNPTVDVDELIKLFKKQMKDTPLHLNSIDMGYFSNTRAALIGYLSALNAKDTRIKELNALAPVPESSRPKIQDRIDTKHISLYTQTIGLYNKASNMTANPPMDGQKVCQLVNEIQGFRGSWPNDVSKDGLADPYDKLFTTMLETLKKIANCGSSPSGSAGDPPANWADDVKTISSEVDKFIDALSIGGTLSEPQKTTYDRLIQSIEDLDRLWKVDEQTVMDPTDAQLKKSLSDMRKKVMGVLSWQDKVAALKTKVGAFISNPSSPSITTDYVRQLVMDIDSLFHEGELNDVKDVDLFTFNRDKVHDEYVKKAGPTSNIPKLPHRWNTHVATVHARASDFLECKTAGNARLTERQSILQEIETVRASWENDVHGSPLKLDKTYEDLFKKMYVDVLVTLRVAPSHWAYDLQSNFLPIYYALNDNGTVLDATELRDRTQLQIDLRENIHEPLQTLFSKLNFTICANPNECLIVRTNRNNASTHSDPCKNNASDEWSDEDSDAKTPNQQERDKQAYDEKKQDAVDIANAATRYPYDTTKSLCTSQYATKSFGSNNIPITALLQGEATIIYTVVVKPILEGSQYVRFRTRETIRNDGQTLVHIRTQLPSTFKGWLPYFRTRSPNQTVQCDQPSIQEAKSVVHKVFLEHFETLIDQEFRNILHSAVSNYVTPKQYESLDVQGTGDDLRKSIAKLLMHLKTIHGKDADWKAQVDDANTNLKELIALSNIVTSTTQSAKKATLDTILSKFRTRIPNAAIAVTVDGVSLSVIDITKRLVNDHIDVCIDETVFSDLKEDLKNTIKTY